MTQQAEKKNEEKKDSMMQRTGEFLAEHGKKTAEVLWYSTVSETGKEIARTGGRAVRKKFDL